jgi:biopolymer transport protein ExbB
MLKMTRLAMLATALVLAMPAALAPSVASAQGQPAPAATPATPPAAPAATTPPPAPAAAAPAAKVGEKTTEIIENPYGLEALWKGGDLVARITLGILVIMSMGAGT